MENNEEMELSVNRAAFVLDYPACRGSVQEFGLTCVDFGFESCSSMDAGRVIPAPPSPGSLILAPGQVCSATSSKATQPIIHSVSHLPPLLEGAPVNSRHLDQSLIVSNN